MSIIGEYWEEYMMKSEKEKLEAINLLKEALYTLNSIPNRVIPQEQKGTYSKDTYELASKISKFLKYDNRTS